METTLEPLRAADVQACVHVLAAAFLDNPASLALIPYAEARRERILRGVMRGFVEATRAAGTATVARADGRARAAMLAFAPGSYPVGWAAYAWLSFGPLAGGVRTAYRYALADQYMRKIHPSGRHWYLFVLGVDPALQGRGLGSRLLAELSARADGEEVPCYLETDKASSVRLYERHGFEVERDETEPRLGVRFWTMSRAPRALTK